MDTRTGLIYEAESAAALAKKLGADEGDIVMLDKLPEGTCRKCHGTGSARAGMFSRRFKPCRCTKAGWAKDRP
jgi:hypothetical protein